MICFLFLVIFGQIKPILHFGKFPFGLIHQKSPTVYECLSKIWGAFLGDQPKWKTSTPVLQSMAQLRPTMGNHLTTNWSWKFTTRPCWCFWSYSPRTFEAQHQGLDWAQYKGLCAQIGLHPWLAKPPPIPWDLSWREVCWKMTRGTICSSAWDAEVGAWPIINQCFPTVEHVPK